MKSPAAIWWIRRDLRLFDNQALQAALDLGGEVIPVFILDPRLLNSRYTGSKRLAFLFESLRSLDAELRARGSRLIVRRGNPVQELQRLLEQTRSEHIFAEPDYSPYAMRRDRMAASQLPVTWVGSPAILPPGLVVKPNGEPYTVFTPFSRAWKAIFSPQRGGLIPAPLRFVTPTHLESLPVPLQPEMPPGVNFPASTPEALRRLNLFTRSPAARVEEYASGRDRPDLEATSQLSPYLRFGLLSAREAAAAAYQAIGASGDLQARQGAEAWLNELIWRDFYIHILYHFPRLRHENYRLPDVKWENNPVYFQAWCEGRTGYPFVDAAMRQLVESGWMHNRLRMVVASFLTKDLLVDWRLGEKYFMQHLVDGDPAANNGGWQWTAGTGTDAAPYFRIFNPVSQSIRHDPQGKYIRSWLPELNSVPEQYLHEPWKMPFDTQKMAGCIIGQDYPLPLVDHAEARQRTLNAYGQHARNP